MEEMASRRMWQGLLRRLRHVHLNEFDHSVHISLRHSLIYVETPKVACSTIKLTLAKLELEDEHYFREDIHNRYLSPLLRPSQVGDFDRFLERQALVSFCFVRNPYERLLSSYLNKIVPPQDPKIFASLLCQLGRDQPDFDQEVSFEEFISCVEQTPVSMMNSHWRPQYYQTFQDSLRYDFIGRLEQFGRDMRTLGEMISCDLSPYLTSWAAHRTNSGDHLDAYYDDDLVRRVHRLYEIDFDTFGYPRALPGR